MRPSLPWLCQGDIFRAVPWLLPRLQDGAVRTEPMGDGAALLVTVNCQMDKRRRNGTAAVTRLQFAPLRALNSLDANQQGMLRDPDLLNPPGLIYVGDVDGDDAVAVLGDLYTLPAAYFDVEVRDFAGDAQLEPGSVDSARCVARAHDERLGRLDEDLHLRMLHKIAMFWVGFDINLPQDHAIP